MNSAWFLIIIYYIWDYQDSELVHSLIFKKEIEHFGDWICSHPQVERWGAPAELVLTAVLKQWFGG
jgi:hypothetical protein